jgi:hypothetical protein
MIMIEKARVIYDCHRKALGVLFRACLLLGDQNSRGSLGVGVKQLLGV